MKQLLQFILNFKSKNIERLDESLRTIMKSDEFKAEIVTHKVFVGEQNAFYRVRMPLSSLVALKKKVDAVPDVESFELFEFKEW